MRREADVATKGTARGFVAGCVLAVVLGVGLAEWFLRAFPLPDYRAYLGEASPLTGVFSPDPDFGVGYQSWEAFAADNAAGLGRYLPLPHNTDPRPVWAFFGNSFIQARHMLADHLRARVSDHVVFNLGKNEHLPVRLAQVKVLLANGMKPERLFINLMPVDAIILGEHPLSTFHVTARGALTYRPSLPDGWLGELTRHSQVALTAWFRFGGQRGNRQFRRSLLHHQVEGPLLNDLRFIFANLARVARQHRVPVTVMLVPAYHQIMGMDGFGFQDTLAPVFRELGLDVFDPRAAFLRQPDKEGLFIPDRHFSDCGNRVLADALLEHVRDLPKPSAPQPSRPSHRLEARRP